MKRESRPAIRFCCARTVLLLGAAVGGDVVVPSCCVSSIASCCRGDAEGADAGFGKGAAARCVTEGRRTLARRLRFHNLFLALLLS